MKAELRRTRLSSLIFTGTLTLVLFYLFASTVDGDAARSYALLTLAVGGFFSRELAILVTGE